MANPIRAIRGICGFFVFSPIAQAEIVAEHWLERLAFTMLIIAEARRVYGSENCADSFYVGAIPPHGQRKHLDHHFPYRLVTLVGQSV